MSMASGFSGNRCLVRCGIVGLNRHRLHENRNHHAACQHGHSQRTGHRSAHQAGMCVDQPGLWIRLSGAEGDPAEGRDAGLVSQVLWAACGLETSASQVLQSQPARMWWAVRLSGYCQNLSSQLVDSSNARCPTATVISCIFPHGALLDTKIKCDHYTCRSLGEAREDVITEVATRSQHEDRMADIYISCSCGWLGKPSQLTVNDNGQRSCPSCQAEFIAFPFKTLPIAHIGHGIGEVKFMVSQYK